MKWEWLAIVTPKQYVKTIKVCLEKRQLINQSIKIKPASSHGIDSNDLVICTSVSAKTSHLGERPEYGENVQKHLIRDALLECLPPDICYKLNVVVVEQHVNPNQYPGRLTFLSSALFQAIWEVEREVNAFDLPDVVTLLFSSPSAYSIYPPLLLLPHSAFDAEPWRRFLNALQDYEGAYEKFFTALANAAAVTHIALDAPVPSNTSKEAAAEGEAILRANLIRSPENLKSLHGDFGPLLPSFPKHIPITKDFEEAFWVSSRQNGILQTWAPFYTMFSSGNVTEKARILKLGSVKKAVQQGKEDTRGCSAVDLFAGIGYFAFSYAKAGVSKILCWDLNPWSVEGLRRGSHLNKWIAYISDEKADSQHAGAHRACKDASKFLVFCESNAHASTRLRELRHSLPPIRHVNCGVLPNADAILDTAVQAVDPDLGGWIHLHESVLENNVKARSQDIMNCVQDYVRLHNSSNTTDACLEHVEKVKSMGPRLLHIVLDIWIPPIRTYDL